MEVIQQNRTTSDQGKSSVERVRRQRTGYVTTILLKVPHANRLPISTSGHFQGSSVDVSSTTTSTGRPLDSRGPRPPGLRFLVDLSVSVWKGSSKTIKIFIQVLHRIVIISFTITPPIVTDWWMTRGPSRDLGTWERRSYTRTWGIRERSLRVTDQVVCGRVSLRDPVSGP